MRPGRPAGAKLECARPSWPDARINRRQPAPVINFSRPTRGPAQMGPLAKRPPDALGRPCVSLQAQAIVFASARVFLLACVSFWRPAAKPARARPFWRHSGLQPRPGRIQAGRRRVALAVPARRDKCRLASADSRARSRTRRKVILNYYLLVLSLIKACSCGLACVVCVCVVSCARLAGSTRCCSRAPLATMCKEKRATSVHTV